MYLFFSRHLGKDFETIYLDSNHYALVLNDSWEEFSSVVLLIESLVEENNSPNLLVDGWVGREENITELTAIFFRILHFDALQPVTHCPYGEENH